MLNLPPALPKTSRTRSLSVARTSLESTSSICLRMIRFRLGSTVNRSGTPGVSSRWFASSMKRSLACSMNAGSTEGEQTEKRKCSGETPLDASV